MAPKTNKRGFRLEPGAYIQISPTVKMGNKALLDSFREEFKISTGLILDVVLDAARKSRKIRLLLARAADELLQER